MLKVNEHPAERVARVILGLALIGAAVTGTLGVWAWIGVVPVATGLSGVCPLYSVFGFSTCPVTRKA